MTTWAIGDLQGCADDFARLLEHIGFDRGQDQLWLAGDLVNRGPDSLGALRAAYALRDRLVCVLGNHDLHLLAQADGVAPKHQADLDPILSAPDADMLLAWLRGLPLVHLDTARNTALVHAGLPPQWTLAQALAEARAVSSVLQSNARPAFLRAMYGNTPDRWQPAWNGTAPDASHTDRLRFAVNCLTRMRYCTPDGALLFKPKGAPQDQASDVVPWFALPQRKSADGTIVFGHWSTLGQVDWPAHRVYALDSGCVWGGALTALNLDTWQIRAVPCAAHRLPG